VAAYAGKQDFIDRLGEDKLVQLTDRDSAGEVDDKRLTAAAESATATIDAYASAIYPTPLNPVNALVKKLCIELAVYELASDLFETDEGSYKIYSERWKAALKFLADVRAGKAVLYVVSDPEPEDAPAEGVAFVVVEDEHDATLCRGVTEWQRL
jgi:phage gp36-like protein